MTDVTSGGRGGVGIRLFVSGGEVVKRTFDQVGDSGKKMWAQIALGEKSANPAFRAISRGANEVGEGVQGLADRTGAFGRSLGAFGVAGVAFAAVMGAVAIAVTKARESMAFADEIDDASEKLNISTDALQEWRAATIAAGGEAGNFDAAVAKFTRTLGAAQSGLSPRAMKPFAALGFSKEDLDNFDSGEEALAEVARRVAALSKESERAAVAEKLGLGDLLPLLRRGADGMEDLRAEARELGLVMDEALVKKGAEANQQLEEIEGTIRVQMAEAFVGLSDEIIAFTQNMADALTALNRFIGRYNEWKARAEITGDAPNQFEKDAVRSASRFGPAGLIVAGASNRLRGAWRKFTGQQPSDEEVDRQIEREREARQPMPGEPPPADDDPENRANQPPPRRSPSRSGRSAEQRERDAARARERLAQEETRAERDAVRARHAGDTAEDRLALARAMLRLDREERDVRRAALAAELKKAGVLDKASEAQFSALEALDAEADALADRAAAEAHRKELAEEALKRDQAREQDALDLLDIEAQLATTRQEQYAIERRILILRQAAERRALEAELKEEVAAGRISEAEAGTRLGGADYRNQLELGLFDDSERERARAEFRSFGHDIIEGVKDGKLGVHIAEEMQARLVDMALNGLFDFLNPRGPDGQAYSPSGGGFLTTAWTAISSLWTAPQGPGRAGGGPMWSGYRHPVAETGRPELMMIGGAGHITDAVATKRMLQDLIETESAGANGGRSVTEHLHKWDLRGAVVTEDLLRQMDAKAAAAETRAVGRSLDASRRGAAGVQTRLRQLGTT